MKLEELLHRCADHALTQQQHDGSFPAGHNGPWRDADTPVRVTSHWAVLFAHVYRSSKQQVHLAALQRCYSFLTSKTALSNFTAFHCRQTKSKSNGLIGQAWALKGLIAASEALQDAKGLEVAEIVFNNHQFNENLGLWYNLSYRL